MSVPIAAAELAARIEVPRRLPPRYDGQPLAHLSHSSYTRFICCPEDWRRHYLAGERFAPTGSMFLGRRVDDALSLYYRRIIESGDRLALEDVNDAYRDGWHEELERERASRGVAWDDGLDDHRAFELGLEALELTFRELVPEIGRPVSVQRRLEYRIAPDLKWTVLCYLDLEATPHDDPTAAPDIVDYKVKGSTISSAQADADAQPGLYLAGRWLEGNPAPRFSFAQIAKPGKRRKTMSASFISTQRTPGQLRGMLVRIAQAARQIVASYERFGPDQHWGFADPAHWKCSPRYCERHASCPGGAGV